MERDRADCEMEMEAAAFVKWRICASARKYSSWLRSMGDSFIKYEIHSLYKPDT